jgi:hypothetical protein
VKRTRGGREEALQYTGAPTNVLPVVLTNKWSGVTLLLLSGTTGLVVERQGSVAETLQLATTKQNN